MASSGHLKPGEKGKIKVTVDTRGKAGYLYKTVQVQTNATDHPTSILSVTVQVKVPPKDVVKPPAGETKP